MDALDQLQRIIDRPKRRRRQAVIVTVWIALAALATGMTIQLVRASREAERANIEAATAQKVSDFLVISSKRRIRNRPGVRHSQPRRSSNGAPNITGELEEQPLTRARLLMTIGSVYTKMGLYADAIPLFEDAAAIRTRELGEDHEDVAAVLNDLGMAYLSNGDSGMAEECLLRALVVRERSLGPNDVATAHTALNLGNLFRSAGRFE